MGIKVRVCLFAFGSALLAGACTQTDQGENQAATGSGDDTQVEPCGAACLRRTDLVSNLPGVADRVDPQLVNAWGIAPTLGAFWIADSGSGYVSIYDGTGAPARTAIASGALTLVEGITGVAVNDTSAFVMTSSSTCGAARLIFATEDGQLIAVSPDVDKLHGVVVVDREDQGAGYFGVAILDRTILAADFHHARIDVFDENFRLVTTPAYTNPAVPSGYAPFNVAVLGGIVYVAYAKQDEAMQDEVVGPGLGYISAFDPSGRVLWTVHGAPLDAPWGLALAPSTFAAFPNALIVGNFGDGKITAIDLTSQRILGQLSDSTGAPISVDKLWGISFGDAVNNADPNALYFAAGPDDEVNGLFGVIASCHH